MEIFLLCFISSLFVSKFTKLLLVYSNIFWRFNWTTSTYESLTRENPWSCYKSRYFARISWYQDWFLLNLILIPLVRSFYRLTSFLLPIIKVYCGVKWSRGRIFMGRREASSQEKYFWLCKFQWHVSGKPRSLWTTS